MQKKNQKEKQNTQQQKNKNKKTKMREYPNIAGKYITDGSINLSTALAWSKVQTDLFRVWN